MSAKAAPAAAPEAAQKKSKKKLLIIVAAVVLIAAGGGAGWFFMRPKHDAKHAEAEEVKPAQYIALSPAFVVNLADNEAKYLQADVQLMTHDEETKAALELHAPAIRNRLLLLFGTQKSSELADRAGKERLQKQALAEVKAVLKAQKAPDKIDGLYFTSLVTQ